MFWAWQSCGILREFQYQGNDLIFAIACKDDKLLWRCWYRLDFFFSDTVLVFYDCFWLVLMTKLRRCSLVSPKLLMNRKKAFIWRELGRHGILSLFWKEWFLWSWIQQVLLSAGYCAKLWGWKMCSEDPAPVMIDIAV